MPFLLIWGLASMAWATVTVTRPDCPVKFRGEVKELIDSLGAEEALATQRVIFKTTQALQGNVDQQVSVEMLANGPVKIRPGEEYLVQLRDNRICWIERI
jgi:hypothetical protein